MADHAGVLIGWIDSTRGRRQARPGLELGRIEDGHVPADHAILINLPPGFPAEIAGTADAFANEFRLAAAIEWYREGRVSQGRGAEVAGLSRAGFLDALARAKVSRLPDRG